MTMFHQVKSELDFGQNFFISWFSNLPTVIFQKVEKKNLVSKIFFFILSTDSIYYLFRWKKIFLRFCLCIFESDTVKCDYPVQIFWENDKLFKDLIQTVGLPY